MVSPQRQWSSSAPTPTVQRSIGHSMRTFRSRFYDADRSCSFSSSASSTLTDSAVDFRLRELASAPPPPEPPKSSAVADLLDVDFSDFHSFGSDISGELQRLAVAPICPTAQDPDSAAAAAAANPNPIGDPIVEPASVDSIGPIVRSCVEILEANENENANANANANAVEEKIAAAEKLRLLAKNRSDFRTLIGSSGAIPPLVGLLRSSNPLLQENCVTALLNLSLEEPNKSPITAAGAIKPLVYALKTGSSVSKQNAACALLSLSLIEDNRNTIGACGAIPPLVSLLIGGNSRGKKDALTTLYKLCSTRQNKERAVRAGAVAPLVGMVLEHRAGMMEKAMVVLSSLAGVKEGRDALLDEGGIQVLVEALEDGTPKGKEFAVLCLLHLCSDCPTNRAFLVREGAIPPLVALSQFASAPAKHKAEILLGYLREQRQDGILA